ncbi:MAG: hypothetical protein IJN70_04220 [Clostridia bacterium]|nr:hypothetical protein [Clostridia bacterium]
MKKIISFILAIAVIFSIVPTVSALDATNYSAASPIETGTYIQADNVPFTDTWYKFTAEEDQYYKVSILNQSVELRTNIYFDSWQNASFLSGLFNGKLQVAIRDAYGLELAAGYVRCGYEGSVYLLLKEGQTYYIGFNSNYSGNYRFKVDKLNDIGGNTQAEATGITATSQIVTMIDAVNDKDWFTFTTDSDHSFYHFSVENLNCDARLYFYLYEYVEGAGLRDVCSDYSSRSETSCFNVELKDNTKYYYYVTSSAVGGYVINVEQIYDEVSAERSYAYEIERDVKITSSYDGDSDRDYYRFTTGDEDAYYHINYKPLADVYYYIGLYDKTGTKLLGKENYGSYSYNGTIKLENNAEYYLYFEGKKAGNYEFSVDTYPDPAADVKEAALEIQTDKKISATYAGYGDVDFYRFTTGKEDAYYHVNYKPLTDVYYYINLYDAAGTKLLGKENYGTYSYNGTVKLEKNTEYYLSIKGKSAGNYEISVDTHPDPAPDVKEAALEIQTDKKISATYAGYGDVDFYRFTTGKEDAYYHVNYKPLTDVYYYINLYDAAGTKLLVKENNGTYSYNGTVKLEKNTEYYLSIKGKSAGNYEISVDTFPDPEGNDKANAFEIRLNQEYKRDYAGNYDGDWYSFATSSDEVFIKLSYTSVTDCGDYRLCLYNEAGEELFSLSGYGIRSSSKGIKLEKDSQYFLYVKGQKTGDYKLQLSAIADPAGEKKADAYEISLNTEIKADLVADSDVDWYKFTVTDFENCRIRLLNESGYAKRVYLYSERDMGLLNFSGTGNKTIELEGGTYYLVVYESAGFYSLAVGTCGGGHVWEVKRVVKPATCGEKGRASYCCTCCYETKTEDTPKLTEHSFEWVTISEPTVSADGKKRQECTVCSAYGDTQIIPRHKRGDVDFDGYVTASDARFTLRAAVGLEKCETGTIEFSVADADGDSRISAADARIILRASVGLEKLN